MMELATTQCEDDDGIVGDGLPHFLSRCVLDFVATVIQRATEAFMKIVPILTRKACRTIEQKRQRIAPAKNRRH